MPWDGASQPMLVLPKALRPFVFGPGFIDSPPVTGVRSTGPTVLYTRIDVCSLKARGRACGGMIQVKMLARKANKPTQEIIDAVHDQAPLSSFYQQVCYKSMTTALFVSFLQFHKRIILSAIQDAIRLRWPPRATSVLQTHRSMSPNRPTNEPSNRKDKPP